MGSGASKITAKDRAVLELKIQRDKLKVYQKQLLLIAAREVEIAKVHLANKDRKRALLALKKKKYQDQLLEQSENQLFVLEQLTQQVESALIEQLLMKGLEAGNKVLKELHQETSLELVEKLMDDTRDAIEYQRQIEEVLSGPITDLDEAALLEELEHLQQLIPDLAMPDVPSTALMTEASTEKHEMSIARSRQAAKREEEAAQVLA